MKKPQTNYAFIDGNNLHLSVMNLDWKLDYRRFRRYLAEKYGAEKAYYFIGYVPRYKGLYSLLESAGFILKFKEVSTTRNGEVKGNIDAELVLQAMIDIKRYRQALLISSDGDFACLVNYWRDKGKFGCVLAPRRCGCSHLLKKAAMGRLDFVEDLRHKLEYKS